MASVSVVYQSRKGHTKVLAETVLRGVDSIDGVSGKILEIRGPDIHEGRFANESLMGERYRSDAVVFGCATYMGSGSAIFKAFLEAACEPHWLEQRRKDKIAAGFTEHGRHRYRGTPRQSCCADHAAFQGWDCVRDHSIQGARISPGEFDKEGNVFQPQGLRRSCF